MLGMSSTCLSYSAKELDSSLQVPQVQYYEFSSSTTETRMMSPIPCVAVELAKARHASRLRQANSCFRNFFQQQFSPSFAEPELHLLFGAMILNATPQVQHCKIPHLRSILLLLLLSHQATTISGRLSSALGPFANIFLLCLETQTRVALLHLSCRHVIITTQTTTECANLCKFWIFSMNTNKK